MNRVFTTLSWTLVLACVLAGVSACGGKDYPSCVGAVRFGDTMFKPVGFTDHKGAPLKQSATFATCDDVNRDGVPKALRNTAKPVKVRSLPGFPSGQVVAVQVTGKAWSVLISTEGPKQDLLQRMHKERLLNAGQQ